MVFRLFPSIFENPANIRFSEQENNEKLELFLRQHPIVNLPWIFFSLTGVVLPIILLQIETALGLRFTSGIPLNTLLGGLVIYYLLIIGYVVEQFLHWYFNIYIVTNIHIVDVDFDSLLYRNIKELNLTDIEGVSAKVSGVLAPLFNYGDITIETAAQNQAATFIKVPRPDYVADRINDLKLLRLGSHPDTGP